MKHSISHDLDPGTLKRAIDAALRSYAAELSKYSPTIAPLTGLCNPMGEL